MPAISPKELVRAIEDAVDASGGSCVLLSGLKGNPRRLAIAGSYGDFVAWIYIWTLTHGGRDSLPDEYRIQMTSVESPLALNPDGVTALMGYDPDNKVFAGFDLARHREFTTGSPSVQISRTTLRESLTEGFATQRKSNDEIAVAMRPDLLLAYLVSHEVLHREGADEHILRLLNRAARREQISHDEVASLSLPRKKLVTSVSKWSRSSQFRDAVLNAYGLRCAVTRAQLRLVEAAHILPVAAPNSSDAVENGLALSPTYHRAFDNGLIFLDEDFEMRLNESRVEELRAANLQGGLESFKEPLGRIHLPSDERLRPSLEVIRSANEFRRVTT